MIQEIARIQPRGRTDVEVRLQRTKQGSTLILRIPEGEEVPLTAIGYFAFLQMDGQTTLSELQHRIESRFEGAGVDIENLCRLTEQLQSKGLLFEDERVVRARSELQQAGISARRSSDKVADERTQDRHNEDVAALVHAGFAALVGSEFPRAVTKFKAASEAMPRSLRLARLVDVLERINAGDEQIASDPWVGIERMVEQAIAQRVCPACGGHLRQTTPNAYRCDDCASDFHK